jgi:hypothetical protein
MTYVPKFDKKKNINSLRNDAEYKLLFVTSLNTEIAFYSRQIILLAVLVLLE